MHRLLVEYIVALLAMTAISVVTGWLLAGRALAPLRDITATARRVSGENLGERIALTGPADELRELADTFDGMLARLDGAFASQRHFVANASHELRTPLAIMRTEVDVALADPDASTSELRAMGEAILETVDRCERLIASLLLLARSQATDRSRGARRHRRPRRRLRHRPARPRRRRPRSRSAPSWRPRGSTPIPGLLERLIANLLDNGIHHNVPGGFLSVNDRGARAAGCGWWWPTADRRIEPAELAELAEPFRRLTRSGPGFGLGLSIVRSVAEAHGGTVTLSAPPRAGWWSRRSAAPARRPRAASRTGRGAARLTWRPRRLAVQDR